MTKYEFVVSVFMLILIGCGFSTAMEGFEAYLMGEPMWYASLILFGLSCGALALLGNHHLCNIRDEVPF